MYYYHKENNNKLYVLEPDHLEITALLGAMAEQFTIPSDWVMLGSYEDLVSKLQDRRYSLMTNEQIFHYYRKIHGSVANFVKKQQTPFKIRLCLLLSDIRILQKNGFIVMLDGHQLANYEIAPNKKEVTAIIARSSEDAIELEGETLAFETIVDVIPPVCNKSQTLCIGATALPNAVKVSYHYPNVSGSWDISRMPFYYSFVIPYLDKYHEDLVSSFSRYTFTPEEVPALEMFVKQAKFVNQAWLDHKIKLIRI